MLRYLIVQSRAQIRASEALAVMGSKPKRDERTVICNASSVPFELNRAGSDAYFGRAPAIIKRRETIKQKTIEYRRLLHRKLAA